MKIIITERQFKFLLNRIVESEEEWRQSALVHSAKERPDFDFIRNEEKITRAKHKCKYYFDGLTVDQIIDRGLTNNTLSNFDKFICYLLNVGKKYGYGTIARKKSYGLDELVGYLNNIEIESDIKMFLLKLGSVLKNYSDRTILTKIFDILLSLSAKPSEEIIDLIDKSIAIMDHERFNEKRKKDLNDFIMNTEVNSQNFDQFMENFFSTLSPSLKYEKSFEHEKYFVLDQTSPQIDVTLQGDVFTKYGVSIKKDRFDNEISDLNKVLYLINSISRCKNCEGESKKNVVEDTFSKLNFNIVGDGQGKRDLTALEDLGYKDYDNLKQKEIVLELIKKGKGVEVKYKPSNQGSYLSEFFKVDSTEKNTNTIKSALHMIGVDYKFFMEKLVDRLFEAAKKTSIISDLTKNLSGIIFNENTFIQNKDNNIKFYWCKNGYANKDRLTVCYKVEKQRDFYFEKPLEDMVFGKITGRLSNRPFN